MKITKGNAASSKSKVAASDDIKKATYYVRSAIDCLCKVPNDNVVACDSIANLSVVLFDLQQSAK